MQLTINRTYSLQVEICAIMRTGVFFVHISSVSSCLHNVVKTETILLSTTLLLASGLLQMNHINKITMETNGFLASSTLW